MYASIFDPNDSASLLMPIETDSEWEIVERILEEIQEEAASATDEE